MYHEVVKLFDYYCILLIATTASHVSNTEDNSTPQKLKLQEKKKKHSLRRSSFQFSNSF